MWTEDELWIRAAGWVISLSQKCSWVLAPQELQRLSPRCLPLEFSNIIDPQQKCAIVMLKDAVDRLALEWIKRLEEFHILHVDAVFVIMSTVRLPDVEPASSEMVNQESPYLWDKVKKILSGQPVRRNRLDDSLTTALPGEPYCLVINACLAGNAGETLLAASAREIMAQVRPDLKCVVADPDIDRTLVAGASIVIIGPGGMLYDLVDHAELAIDFQNIANYFRFGYVAREYGRPFCLMGIAHQQRLISRTTIEFVSKAVADAEFANTRDLESATILSRDLKFQRPLVATPDVCVVFSEAIRSVARRPRTDRTVAVCGSVGRDTLISGLKEHIGTVRFVLQGAEDFGWFERNEAILRSEMRGLEVADVRLSGVEPFLEAIATADVVISTRFHAMMIALIAGVDTLVVGVAGDKRSKVCAPLVDRRWVRFFDYRAVSEHELRAAITEVARSGTRNPDRGLFDGNELDPLRGLIEYAAKASPRYVLDGREVEVE